MFESRTSWSSGRYIQTFRFPKDMHLFQEPGRWTWQNRKLKEHLLWGRSQKNEVCTGGIFLYQFTNFLYLAESCGWVQQKHFCLPKHHIRISRDFATLMRPIVRNTGCDPFFLQHLLVRPIVFYNTSNCIKTRLINWKQGPGIQSWISKLCSLISRNY